MKATKFTTWNDAIPKLRKGEVIYVDAQTNKDWDNEFHKDFNKKTGSLDIVTFADKHGGEYLYSKEYAKKQKEIDDFSSDVWYKNQKFKEGRINLKDLIKEERSKTFDLFLKKDLAELPRDYSAKIIGGSGAMNKLGDALIAWDSHFRKTNKYKEGDIEKFARKFVGDARINKAKKWWKGDDDE